MSITRAQRAREHGRRRARPRFWRDLLKLLAEKAPPRHK